MHISFVAYFLVLFSGGLAISNKCEVCKGLLGKFRKYVNENGIDIEKFDVFQKTFIQFCSTASKEEQNFCYLVGGSEISAFSILKDFHKVLAFGKPIDNICEENIMALNPELCDMRYEKKIDVTSIDLTTLPIRELKKILRDWDEECVACSEKTDWINKIKEVQHKHLPKKSEL